MMQSPITTFKRFKPAFNRGQLAIDALKRAGKLRQEYGLTLHLPLCPLDLAHQMGIDVRFENLPSMEGMFCQRDGRPIIVLASERPTGRQKYTCAHEIGHYVYGHGESLDEMLDSEAARTFGASSRRSHLDPKEFSADCFAGFLLMPLLAVERAFNLRKIQVEMATPEEIFQIATFFGVGYATLITHLQCSLRRLSPERADYLKRAGKLPKIKSNLVGVGVKHVTVVNENWEGRPVDVHINDHVLLPENWTVPGNFLDDVGLTPSKALIRGRLLKAERQGEGMLLNSEGKILKLRVSRQGFSGRSIYRHLDDPDEETE